MPTKLGQGLPPLLDEWEFMGERIVLPPEIGETVTARQNAMRYATVDSVSLASFVRGVRQV